jgi:predicted RNA polymerase sigma factor
MSESKTPDSHDTLKSIIEFAFDPESDAESHESLEQVQATLKEQGTDLDKLVARMRQFLDEQRGKLFEAEMVTESEALSAKAVLTVFPSLPEMREVIVNYGFAARLTNDMEQEDIQALYSQVVLLADLEKEE